MFVLEGEVLSTQDAIHDMELANEQAQQFREAAECLREVDKLSVELQAFTGRMVNRRQTIDKVYTHKTITAHTYFDS